MSEESGMMPKEYIDRPSPPFVQLKVKDLKPEHGERFIGVGNVAVDECLACNQFQGSQNATKLPRHVRSFLGNILG